VQYETLIREKFKLFNYTPRELQVENINKILEAYIDQEKTNVVFSASTGVGKSIIAIITAECLYELVENKHNRLKSFLLAHNNTLLEQYINSYANTFEFLEIKGKNNYSCPPVSGNAEECVFANLQDGVLAACQDCEYKKVNALKNSIAHLCTNYSYFFSVVMNTPLLFSRVLTVYDEAHLLNDVFVNHLKIEITPTIMDKYNKELKEYNSVCSLERKQLTKLSSMLAENVLTEDDECIDKYLTDVEDCFGTILKNLNKLISSLYSDGDITGYKKAKKLFNKYDRFVKKITYYLEEKYENVKELNEKGLVIQTIFIKDQFEKIQNSDYHLFMSATIDNEFMEETLQLNPEDTVFINGGNIFPSENKEVVFLNLGYFDYRNMQDTNFLDKIMNTMGDIIKDYGHEQENGIVLSTSFNISSAANRNLIKFFNKNNIDIKIFNQEQGVGLRELLLQFKEYPEPSILISPSLFEGIDLPDDQSRYQFLIKCPFYSLGDKRIKYIADNHPIIYKKLALYKIIQSFGRSVRSPDDYCVNYCFDSQIYNLFTSKLNYWKKEFTVTVL